MKIKLIKEDVNKVFAIVFDSGEEFLSGLKSLAETNDLIQSHFTGIGAFNSVVLGYFDIESKQYIRNRIQEQVEVISLIGDISTYNGKPNIHAHVVIAKKDNYAFGGHVLEAYVRPTLEIVLVKEPDYLHREFDAEFNLPLLRI